MIKRFVEEKVVKPLFFSNQHQLKNTTEEGKKELFEEVQIFKTNGRESKSYTTRILIGKHLVLNKQWPSSM